MSPKEQSIHYSRVHLAVKYSTLRFPLDPRTVAHFSTEKGWIVPPDMAMLPLGGVMTGAGLIASKGSSQIRYNTESKVIAVEGRQGQQVAGDFEELEAIITDVVDFDSKSHAEYYEMVAEGYCSGGRKPLESLAELGRTTQLTAKFDGLVGDSTSLFGVHLKKDKGDPGDSDWWDLSLAVLIFRPDKYYAFQLVRRSPVRDNVIEVTKGAGGIIKEAVARLEG